MRAAPRLFVLAGCMVWTTWAQSTVFEVATVRPNHSGENMRTFPRMINGTFTAQSASLTTLLTAAYGLNATRVEAPGWFATEKYDITAKAPNGVPDSEVMPLLQALLKERFRLKAHF